MKHWKLSIIWRDRDGAFWPYEEIVDVTSIEDFIDGFTESMVRNGSSVISVKYKEVL